MPVGFPDYYGGLTLPVTVAEGGTGQTSLTDHGVLVGAGTSGVNVTLAGSVGDVLQVPSGGGDPVFQSIDISATGITGVLPIANGGTDLSALGSALTVLRVNSSGTALEYNAVALASAMVSGVLPVANGGTGTSSPALVAGSNISITGSWPDNTIAVATSPTFTGSIVCEGAIGINRDSYPGYYWRNAAGTAHWGIKENATGGTQNTLQFANVVSGHNPITIDTSDNVTLYNPLPVSSGGIGATSFAAAGLPELVASVDLINQTASISATTFYTPSAAGFYQVIVELYTNNVSGSSDRIYVYIYSTQETYSLNPLTLDTGSFASGKSAYSVAGAVYSDASKPIQYNVLATLGASDVYDLHIRLVKL